MFLFLDKETKRTIKEAQKKIIWEAKKRKELLNTEIDYNYLQTLIERINENPDLAITIHFKSGDTMTLQQKYSSRSQYNVDDDFNGNPTVEEIR